jgi:hypothetical protein
MLMSEPVAWMYERPNGSAKLTFVREPMAGTVVTETPLYTHPAKTQELLKQIQELKEKLMMEEESYILLDEELLCAKEAIKQQQVKIKVLKAKTLTDEEIDSIGDEVSNLIDTYAGRREFARAILRKAQEK